MPAKVPCRKVVPPRAHARRCAWATWATTAARSAFSSALAMARRGAAGQIRQLYRTAAAVARRVGVWNAGATAQGLRRGVNGTARRLPRGIRGVQADAHPLSRMLRLKLAWQRRRPQGLQRPVRTRLRQQLSERCRSHPQNQKKRR